MPSYDLTCRRCQTRFEKFVPRLLRNEDMVCPSCGSTDIKRGVGGGVLGRWHAVGFFRIVRARADRLSVIGAGA